MKKNLNTKLYLLFAIFLGLLTGSCSDSFFDQQAGDRMTPDKHYKSYTDALVSMEGAITPLRKTMPNLIMIDGLRSDQMEVTSNADAYLKAINQHDFTADNPYLNASDYYKVIIDLNEILANVDQVPYYDRDFTQNQLHYFKGAVIGQRSWVYFNLLKLYGKAAYIKDNMTKLPESLVTNMMEKDVLIDTLINQLLPVIFDPKTDIHVEEQFSSHYVNPKALLGELYLEKRDYPNAVKYIKMGLESYANKLEQYKVDKTYSLIAWKNIFLNGDQGSLNLGRPGGQAGSAGPMGSAEIMGVIPFNRNEAQDNPLPDFMMYSKQYLVKPTQLLVDSFKNQVQLLGVIGDIYRGIGVSIDTAANGDYYIKKYSVDLAEPTSSDIILERATDLHLLLAEALNRSGDSKTALILLNDGFNAVTAKPSTYAQWSGNIGVRGRVYLKTRVVPIYLPASVIPDYVEDLIMDERSLELAFEGKRWFDLVRVANRRNDPAYLANKVAAKFAGKPEYNAIKAKLMNKANWYLPMK